MKQALSALLLSLGLSVPAVATVRPLGNDELSIESLGETLRIGLRVVSYRDKRKRGGAVLNRAQARTLLNEVNRFFTHCQVRFEIEEFSEVDPSHLGLKLHPGRMEELASIRQSFEQYGRLVLIFTGTWDQRGGLGADGANAWTMMPGLYPAGAVIEGTVATYAGIVAHELGHYLNLEHFEDDLNLMNPVIYRRSVQLNETQCAEMRAAARTWHSTALRSVTSS